LNEGDIELRVTRTIQSVVGFLNFMPVIDYPSIPNVVVMNTARPISGVNQKTYARLKTSLRLNLRRQIFLAVCDDLELRSQLVSQLQAELAPDFVSLNLNLADPNPMAQVSQWLRQQNQVELERSPTPGFQILGIEHLTRQPVAVQKRFLTHLQAIEYYMPALECTLLLWVPRPWLRSICQSAPTFWDWHTALFEFEGDPTPLHSVQAGQSQTAPHMAAPDRASMTRLPLAQIESWAETIPLDLDAIELEENTLLQEAPLLSDTLWDVLAQDVARPDAPIAPTIVASETVPLIPVVESRSLPTPDQSKLTHPSPLKQALFAALEQDPTAAQHQAGLESLQRIEQLQQQQIPSDAVAAAYYSLGRAYRECIEQGDSSEHTLEIAIAAHEQTIALLAQDSILWADVVNDLGNLYWMRSRNAVEAAQQLGSLKQAIHAYELALVKTDGNANPATCAMIQNNLGSAYGDLAQYLEPADNLQKSVQAYEAALQYRSVTADPTRYAATQNNLGTAYWNLAQHQQPVTRLQQAIAAYQQALHYYTADAEPLSYAMIQNNMGTAYWNLAQHLQSPKNRTSSSLSPNNLLKLAIVAYQNALVYRTLETVPAGYAATQNNLGTAHWDLAMLVSTSPRDRVEHFKQSISAYEAAIAAVEVMTEQSSHRPALTFDVCATHNNLGLAYYHLTLEKASGLTASDRQQALETALNHHLEALQGWGTQPEFQSTTLEFVVQVVRALFNQFGIQGQNLALSQIPPAFLPQVMSKL